MTLTLTFSFNYAEYPAVPTKIYGKKLYGWTETLALDDNGNECKLFSVNESGAVIGIGLGIVTENEKWCNRSRLKVRVKFNNINLSNVYFDINKNKKKKKWQ